VRKDGSLAVICPDPESSDKVILSKNTDSTYFFKDCKITTALTRYQCCAMSEDGTHAVFVCSKGISLRIFNLD